MFWVQVAGVCAVVGTIVVAQCSSNSTGHDMANAIGQMAAISKTLKDEQSAIQSQANATENLAVETRDIAVAAGKQAEAQSKQLALNQAAKVDLDIHVSNYAVGAPIEAHAVIVNGGANTVHGALTIFRLGMGSGIPFDHIWKQPIGTSAQVDIVPGVPHDAPVLAYVDDQQWNVLRNRTGYVVFGARLNFKDASGKRQQLQRCLAINGAPNDMHPLNC